MAVPQAVQSLLKKKKIRFLDLKFIDLVGRWHHITLPVARMKPELFERGVGVDGSSLGGFRKVKAGDMVLIPDPASALVDPLHEQPTLSLIGSIHEVGSPTATPGIRAQSPAGRSSIWPDPALPIRASGVRNWSSTSSTGSGTTRESTRPTTSLNLKKRTGKAGGSDQACLPVR